MFITNLRSASLLRAGLDFETLHAAHPRLVQTSITGCGLTSPAADTPAFDIAAMAAALGTVTALLARERSGVGRLVESSLLRAGACTGAATSPTSFAGATPCRPAGAAAGCFVEVADGEGGGFRAPAPPERVEGGDGPKRAPPRLGRHTDELLAELGFDRAQIGAARQAGYVA